MMRWMLSNALVAAAFSVVPAAAQTTTPAKMTIAVIDLRDGGPIGFGEDMSKLGIGIASSLSRLMSGNDRLDVIERAAMQTILDEHKLSLSGVVDAATAAQVGKLVGAKYIVLGAYMGVAPRLRIDARIVEVETGRQRRAQEVTDRFENLFESVDKLADLLFRDLQLTPTTPPARQTPVPARAVLMLSRGIGHEDRGEIDQAKAMYRAALELAPDWADARDRLAKLEAR